MSLRFFTAKTLLWGLALLPFVAVAQVQRQMQSVPRRDTRPVEVAVFSINDFHGAFIASPEKGIAGAAAVCETLDSLKKVYPFHLTVSAGDNFGGSYFYKVTGGQLMPLFFHEAGIRLSALGNHEFDDGQDALAAKWADSPLRPKDWDMTYVCANVRNTATGTLPSCVSASALTEVTLPGGKTLPVAFAGLITSATPHQVSARRVKGLCFDGRYDVVLDSLLATPEGKALAAAPLRLLLAHIGTTTNAEGQPVWDDPDAEALTKLRPGDWHGFFSSHTHQKVRGHTNKNRMPAVQGLWHADYISALIFSIDTTNLDVVGVKPCLFPVTQRRITSPGARRLQQVTDSLLLHTTIGGLPLSEHLTTLPEALIHRRNQNDLQTELGTLVTRAYENAFRRDAHCGMQDVVIGCSHFGSIRAALPKGEVTVLDAGEALPFANKLRAYSLTGRQLRDGVDSGLRRPLGRIQLSSLEVKTDGAGHVKKLVAALPSGKKVKLKDKQNYVLVVDEYMTTGGDGYSPSFFPEAQEVTTENMPTTTDSFIQYLKEIGKGK